MGITCLECGGEGFSNAFVFCVECLDFALHRYCLPKLPETFDEFVHWVCEDCQSMLNESTSQENISLPSRKGDESSSEHFKPTQFVVELTRNDLILENVTKEHQNQCRGHFFQKGKEACVELDLTDSPQLACEHSSRKEELKKEKKGKSLVTEAKEPKCQSSHLHRRRGALSAIASTKYIPISDDFSSLRIQSGKNAVNGSVDETQDQRVRVSASRKPQRAHRKDVSTDYHLASDFRLKRKLERNELNSPVPKIEKRLEVRTSQKSIHEGRKLDLNEQDESKHLVSPPKQESNKRRNICGSSVEEAVKRAHKSEQPHATNSRQDLTSLAMLMNGSDVNRETRIIPVCHGKGKETVKLGEETSYILKDRSELIEKVSQSASDGSPNISQPDLPVCAQPVFSPIWRGSFNIINKDNGRFDGFVAHLSSMACSKVFQEASLLPSLLCLEMLPKSHVWPKSFERSEPSHDSIALYFFPMDRSRERTFDYLVQEMTDKELGMRVVVKNAELLIFSSTELPLFYWRFQGKYYMWGVFRGKQTCQSVNPSLVVQSSSSSRACVLYSDSADTLSD